MSLGKRLRSQLIGGVLGFGHLAGAVAATPPSDMGAMTSPVSHTVPIQPPARALRRVEEAKGVVAVGLGSRGIKNVRLRVMRQTAYTLGVQSGAHWREQQVNAILHKNAANLDKIFDFRPLLLDHGQVLPPVIDVVHGAIRLDSPTSGSSVVTTYRIEAPAKLVSTPPNWRSWIVLHFPPLTRVSRLLLPKTDAEKKVWAREVVKGWAVGVQEYNAAYAARLHSLERDYIGIVRYTILAQQHIISVPQFATGNLGIQIHGHQLDIGQRLFRISWPSGFTSATHWHPVAVSVPKQHGSRR